MVALPRIKIVIKQGSLRLVQLNIKMTLLYLKGKGMLYVYILHQQVCYECVHIFRKLVMLTCY